MTEHRTTAEKNVANLQPHWDLERQPKFCLSQMVAFESDEETLLERRNDLIQRAEWNGTAEVAELECSIGGCYRVLRETYGTASSRTLTGICKAAEYCLKESFELSNSRESYREIMDTCHGVSDQYNAGNICPRLDCGLSAGVSIDGHANTAGECVRESNVSQLELPIIPSV